MIVTVNVNDDKGIPVSGASVAAELLLEGMFFSSLSGTTDLSGAAVFKINNAPSGSYSITIIDVSAAGLIWDDITPDNNFTK
jgi:hypothetical protein